MFISDLSIKQPVLSTMLAVSLVVLGLYSYRRLSVDLFPDVEIPVITVQTVYPGASPETVEREVTKRIEESLNTISGVRHIQSTTTEGLSVVVVEFRLGTNIHTAQQDAQAKINSIRANFPDDMKEPVIQRIDFNALPIVSIAVESATADIKALSSIAEKVIKKRLENVPGVGEVKLVGLARREISTEVDAQKLRSLGITYPEVSAALRRDNMDLPAGKLEAGRSEPLVRVSGKMKSVEAFDQTIVAMRGGRPVYLPEIARIVDTVEDRRSSASMINGKPGLSMDIVKQSGANTIDVADGIEKAIVSINAELPPHIRLRTVVDTSMFIRESVEDVETTMVIGGLLTVLIVFLFLNSWRSTVITGLALPVSVISTFIVMNALGFTLNVLTLMGLSLAIGLLIDDAIVVRKHRTPHARRAGPLHCRADCDQRNRPRSHGDDVHHHRGFRAVAFMGGIIGKFFYEFGITVGFAVLVSLYVSFTLDPMLSSRWYDPAADPKVRRKWFGRALSKVNDQVDKLQGVLGGILGWSLRHRWAVVLAGGVAIFSSFSIFGLLGSAFMPEADPGDMMVTYRARPGISQDASMDIARQLDAEIRGNKAIAYTYATIGGSGDRPLNEGRMYVKMTPPGTRPHLLQVKDELRASLARFRAITTAIGPADESGGETKQVQVSVRGNERSRLVPLSERVLHEIRSVPNTVDIDTSEEPSRSELQVYVDRASAGDLGLDVGIVATTVRGLIAGGVVSQFEDRDGDSYDVRLRVDTSHRERGSDLLGLELSRCSHWLASLWVRH